MAEKALEASREAISRTTLGTSGGLLTVDTHADDINFDRPLLQRSTAVEFAQKLTQMSISGTLYLWGAVIKQGADVRILTVK